jgi:hypothetical protein
LNNLVQKFPPILELKRHLKKLMLYFILAILHLLVWSTYDRIVEGRNIAIILSSITVINLLLAILLYVRYRPLAVTLFIFPYLLHIMFFVLFFFQGSG